MGRIAFADKGHVNILPINYVTAGEWVFARVDAALQRAIDRNRWVAIEVAEVLGVANWRSVVLRGACYGATPTEWAADDAIAARGLSRLRKEIPEIAWSGQKTFPTTIIRVHIDDLSGLKASALPRPKTSTKRR
jgi:nitroimidazol reductase NimA-like FMN-containing flavoprotein (pyridoxamine 5'-phosphate oxidase superfamily)